MRQRSDPASWPDRYGDVLYRYAYAHVGDPDLAADLVQECFLAALNASFDGRASERTWLIGILRHKILDHYRRGLRERPARDEEAFAAVAEREPEFDERGHWRARPAKWAASPERLARLTEFRAALAACIEALTAGQRAVFVLRELDGLDTETICKELGLTATNVGVRLFRARMQLRRCLERAGFSGGEL